MPELAPAAVNFTADRFDQSTVRTTGGLAWLRLGRAMSRTNARRLRYFIFQHEKMRPSESLLGRGWRMSQYLSLPFRSASHFSWLPPFPTTTEPGVKGALTRHHLPRCRARRIGR